MIRFLISALFISLILLRPVSHFAWEMWYVNNKAYVSNELCVNKDVPESTCHGKCYLKKQLNKADGAQTPEKQGERPIEVILSKESQCLCAPLFIVNLPAEFESVQEHLFGFRELQSDSFPIPVDHPPCPVS